MRVCPKRALQVQIKSILNYAILQRKSIILQIATMRFCPLDGDTFYICGPSGSG